MSRTSLKFLLVPAVAAHYDQSQLDGLASALRDLGHETHCLLGPVTDSALVKMCREYDLDVVFRVNRGRPIKPELPKTIRHISWFQDFHYDTERSELQNIQPDDILYFLGDPEIQGLQVQPNCRVDALFSGVNPAINTEFAAAKTSKADASICGYMPPPMCWEMWNTGLQIQSLPLPLPAKLIYLLFSRACKQLDPGGHKTRLERLIKDYQSTVELLYQPLAGELDIHKIHAALRQVAINHFGSFLDTDLLCSNAFRLFSMHYPRLLDRLALVRRCLSVTSSVALYGPGWDQHLEFKEFYKGIIYHPRKLYKVYRTTKLNLANNTHGLGIHSRTLECMHAGGVVMAHTSPHDHKRGGMLSKFEPGKHFIQYEQHNVEAVLSKWLTDNAARAAIAEQARKIVIADHTWRHRALQIISDLAGVTIIQHVPSIVQSAALPVGSAR